MKFHALRAAPALLQAREPAFYRLDFANAGEIAS